MDTVDADADLDPFRDEGSIDDCAALLDLAP